MNIGFSDFIQLIIAFIAFIGIMYPMHSANQARAREIVVRLERMTIALEAQGQALLKHDRRTRKTSRKVKQLQKLINGQTGISGKETSG